MSETRITRSMAKKRPHGESPGTADNAESQIPGTSKSIAKKKPVTTTYHTYGQKQSLDEIDTTELYTINKALSIPNIIDGLVRNGGPKDLFKLRQVSQTCHKSLNPILMDRMNKKIEIWRGPIFVGSTRITEYNWDPNFAFLFRQIGLAYCWNLNDILDPLHVKIISQIRLNITILKIRNLDPFSSEFQRKNESKSGKISALIGTFPKLKQIKIKYTRGFGCPLDELELGLRNINPNIKVQIILRFRHDEVLNIFGSKPNYSFITGSTGDDLELFKHISNDFSHLLNWKFNLFLVADEVATTQKLETVVTLILRNQHQFKKLGLYLNDSENEIFLEQAGESVLRSSLTQLSPMLTKLELHLKSKKWDLLGGILTFPKVTHLTLTGYCPSLEFLKHCQGLKYLNLDFDVPRCISMGYSSPIGKRGEDKLKEYFGDLPLLEDLYFGADPSCPYIFQFEVKFDLSQLLPSGTYIYWNGTCTKFPKNMKPKYNAEACLRNRFLSLL